MVVDTLKCCCSPLCIKLSSFVLTSLMMNHILLILFLVGSLGCSHQVNKSRAQGTTKECQSSLSEREGKDLTYSEVISGFETLGNLEVKIQLHK